VSLEQSGGATTNRITSVTEGSTLNYSYDAAGNVTNDGAHSFTYDAENRVVSVDGGSTASYSYDHQNRRVKKTVGSTTTHYVWQGGQVIAEHNGSTGAMVNEYIFAGGRMIAREGGGGKVFFLYGELSAKVTISDGGNGNIQGRQSHLPFGEELVATGTTDKHRFTSYERDSETGTDYAVNRGYSTNTGRFMRPDPYKGSYDFRDPQTLNRYAYVNNDPTNQVDPIGLLNTGGCQFYGTLTLYFWTNTGRIIFATLTNIRGVCSAPERGAGGGGGQGRRRYAPFPTNLRAALRDLLNKNNGECDNFVQNLLHQVASDTGKAAYSDNILELYDTIDSMGGYSFEPPNVPGYPNAGGTVEGSIERGNARVIIAPIPEDDSFTEHGKLLNQYFYVYTALHETLHLAAGHGRYSDRELAQAAFNLGGLSQEDIDYFNSLDKNNRGAMSNFLDYIMQKHCKRP
jgi:RHS repeat-associated protein